ncbi:SusE domain-containing protein [Zhouia sp. PK063]|uniref:SusE domain-containing protein n=1 Tax=Zhouia sp. PK063 TaxID=3373602 RepID=UPI0037950629
MRNLYNIVTGIIALFIVISCDNTDNVMISNDATTTLTASATNVILSTENEGTVALHLSWDAPDFGYNSIPKYKIYMDVAGDDFANPASFSAGSDLSLSIATEALNSKLVNTLGIAPNVPTDIVFKVAVILGTSQEIVYSNTTMVNLTGYDTPLDLSTDWGIVGSAAPNGWDGPDVPFYQTGTANIYAAYPTLIAGDIKFRKDNAWDLNYGDTGVDGTLDNGGDNITVNAGTYKIVLNLNTLTYTMEEYSWGISGTAITTDGNDIMLSYDPLYDNWTTTANLTNGTITFRLNNTDETSYGDTNGDGSLEANGEAINVAAGNYKITVDFNTMSYTLLPN